MTDLAQARLASASGMQAQAHRLRLLSENIANADTPGYRRKMVAFDPSGERGQVQLGPTRLDRRDLPKVFDPSHPMADEAGYYLGSNVDLLVELADAREAQRSYDANLKLFEQARQMTFSLFELLRR